jgi:hypothetical protein
MPRASSLIVPLGVAGLGAVAYFDLQAELRQIDARLGEAERQLALLEPLAELMRPAVTPAGQARVNDPWAPVQATGSPDAGGGESPLAWCPAREDSGPEWIELTFPEGTEAAAVHLYENLNPGAVNRITAVGEHGGDLAPETSELWAAPASPWTGTAPRRIALAGSGHMPVRRLRLDLDTSAVPGWNEIDAVAAVTPDGREVWAESAAASSFWQRDRTEDD